MRGVPEQVSCRTVCAALFLVCVYFPRLLRLDSTDSTKWTASVAVLRPRAGAALALAPPRTRQSVSSAPRAQQRPLVSAAAEGLEGLPLRLRQRAVRAVRVRAPRPAQAAAAREGLARRRGRGLEVAMEHGLQLSEAAHLPWAARGAAAHGRARVCAGKQAAAAGVEGWGRGAGGRRGRGRWARDGTRCGWRAQWGAPAQRSARELRRAQASSGEVRRAQAR